MAIGDTEKITRIELIETRKQIVLAEMGHKLLKQKQDVLIMEFFKILHKAKDLRSELNAKMSQAFQGLAMAEAYHGVFELENIALSIKKAPGVEVKGKNVMGVKIPEIKGAAVQKTLLTRGYSLLGSSAKVDEASSGFEHALDMVIKLAETENALKRLIQEIEKTKRRVNALEYILIPGLRGKAKTIQMRLDEIERDQFIALKMIKKKLGRAEAEEAQAVA